MSVIENINSLLSCGKKVLRLDIPGEPVAQERVKFTKSGHAYDPSKSRKEKKNIQKIAQEQMKIQGFNKAHKDMPITINVCFYRPIPTSKNAWWKMAAKLGLIYPTAKWKDVDNCLKLVSDACNSVVFHDDAQVTDIHAYARYSETPCTIVEIEAFFINIGDVKKAVNGTNGRPRKEK